MTDLGAQQRTAEGLTTKASHGTAAVAAPNPYAPATPGIRGALLWEYKPPRAHPILYAGLILCLAVLLLGSAENALRDNRLDLYLVYAAPPAAIALLMALLWPSPVRLYDNGVAPSRPLALRWHRPFIPWHAVAAVYPVHYDVTGAFVSPFASSDGKVTLVGLGLEEASGRIETLRFTPTRFAQTTRRPRGFREAWPVVQALFAQEGRPLVPSAPSFSAEERATLEAQARAPFLPFFAIVALFACAAPVLWLLMRWGVPPAVALPLCLVLPLATSLRSWWASRRRNRILNTLSKAAEHERTRGATP